MSVRETSESIDAAAAAWAAREDRGGLSDGEKAALQDWLAGDSRRPGAYLRARAVLLRSRLVPSVDVERSAPAPAPAPSRRQILGWGGAATAVVAVGVAAGAQVIAPKAYATERGEMRLAPLADGSTMLLNTESRVKVRYDDRRRIARLIEGEVYFTVLSDPKRPFVVEVDGRRFSARMGTFRIRKLRGRPVDVLVERGWLSLEPSDEAERAVTLAQSSRMVLDASGGAISPVEPVSGELLTRELAWKSGMIAFNGETLAQAAEAFDRYSDIHIIVNDPSLSGETITGLYAANDPVGFARSVAELFGASALVDGRQVVISTAASAE